MADSTSFWSWNIILAYFYFIWQIKRYQIPDSRRATERNGNSRSVDFTDNASDNVENDAFVAIFRQFGSCFLTF